MNHFRTAVVVCFLAELALQAPEPARRPPRRRRRRPTATCRRCRATACRWTSSARSVPSTRRRQPRRRRTRGGSRSRRRKAELAALEGKEEPTEAEQERMAALADEIERLEEAAESGVALEGATSLTEMARRMDAVPAFAAAVRGAGLTTREFATAQLALLQAGIAHALLKSSPEKAPPPGVSRRTSSSCACTTEIEALRSIRP